HLRSAADMPQAFSTSCVTAPVPSVPSTSQTPCNSKNGQTGRMCSPSLKMTSLLGSAGLRETEPVLESTISVSAETTCVRPVPAALRSGSDQSNASHGVGELPPRANASGGTSQISRSIPRPPVPPNNVLVMRWQRPSVAQPKQQAEVRS